MITKEPSNQQTILIPELSQLLSLPFDICQEWKDYLLKNCNKTELRLSVDDHPGEVLSANVYFCYPVLLLPDQSGIRVAKVVDIGDYQDERKRLIEKLNGYFECQGFLFFENDEQIYTKSPCLLPKNWPTIYTMINTNLFDVVNRDRRWVDWLSFINDCQMLLAPSSFLDNRQDSSSASYNGLWIDHAPNWLSNLSSKKTGLYDQGARLYATQSLNELESWLNKIFYDVKQLQVNQRVILADDRFEWTLKPMRRWMLKVLN